MRLLISGLNEVFMHRRNQGKEYCAHNKSRNCPGGLDCCGSHFGVRATGAKVLARRYVRRINRHQLAKIVSFELSE